MSPRLLESSGARTAPELQTSSGETLFIRLLEKEKNMKRSKLFLGIWAPALAFVLACNAVIPSTPIPPSPTLVPTQAPTSTPLPTETPQPSPAPERSILYREDFSGDASDWETGSETKQGGVVVKTVTDEKYVMNLSSTSEYFVSIIDVPNFKGKDFLMSFDFTVVDASFENVADNLWLSFDFRADNPRYYSVSVFMSECRLLYSKSWNTDEDKILWDWTKTKGLNLAPGVTNNFAIEANGTTFTFYVNGEQVNSATDDSLDQEGGVDFTVLLTPANETVTVSFDNLIISAP